MYTALPILAAATLLLAIGLPLVRSWLRDGIFALVPPRTGLQRFMHTSFKACLLGYGAFTSALVALGPEPLGVWVVPFPVGALGLGVGVASLLFVIVAQAQMGRSWRIGIATGATGLVTHGVFRVCRNPIYLGMLGVVLAVCLVAPSGWTVVGLVLVYVVVGLQARAEEEHLLREHGDAFAQWASATGRFVPGIGRLPRQ